LRPTGAGVDAMPMMGLDETLELAYDISYRRGLVTPNEAELAFWLNWLARRACPWTQFVRAWEIIGALTVTFEAGRSRGYQECPCDYSYDSEDWRRIDREHWRPNASGKAAPGWR
jgi:hypothetical protein